MDEHISFPSENIEGLQLREWYTGLPAETTLSLEQRAVTITTLANRALFEIGAELVAAREDYRHNKHGGFETWVEMRLNFSRRTAYNLIHRYETFATVQDIAHLEIALTAQYRLSAPSVPQEAREEAIHRAEAGENITEKLAKEIIEAQRAQQQAEKAEQQARAEAQRAQQEIVNLTQRIDKLQGEIASFVQPEVEIREVEKEVLPPETAATLEKLQLQVRELTEQKKNLSTRVAQLSDEINTWQETHEAERERDLREARICQNWREVTSTFYKQVVKLLGQFPSPLDAQIFAADEWDRLYQMEELAQRFLVECRKLREGPQRIMVDSDP